MKAFLVAILVAGFFGSAQAGELRVDQRISIFAGQLNGELMRVCSGCGCKGGGGYRLPNGKCAPRRSVEVVPR